MLISIDQKLAEVLKEKIFKKISINSKGCFEYTGRRHHKSGYGRLNFKAKEWMAHRLIYLAVHRKFDSRVCVCHKCDNPCCVNPEHLFLGTKRDNFQDMIDKKRARWQKELTPDEIIPGSRLRKKDVPLVFWLRDEIGLTNRQIARLFGYPGNRSGIDTIREIYNGKRLRNHV